MLAKTANRSAAGMLNEFGHRPATWRPPAGNSSICPPRGHSTLWSAVQDPTSVALSAPPDEWLLEHG